MEQIALFDNPKDRSDKLFQWSQDHPRQPVSTVPAGQLFCYQGDPAEYLFEIVSGTVRLSKVTEVGRNIVLGFPSTGAIVGLTGASEYPNSAETIAATKLQPMGRLRFYREIVQNKQARERLFHWIAAQEADAHDHISILAMSHSSSRVATFLIKAVKSQNAKVDQEFLHIDLPMTQRDIASYLAIAPETYSRIVRRLREAGIVRPITRRKNNNIMEIMDFEYLSDIAEGRKI